MRRCGWCGRFVGGDQEPVAGVNRKGEAVIQLLCPPDEAVWRDMIVANQRYLDGLPQ